MYASILYVKFFHACALCTVDPGPARESGVPSLCTVENPCVGYSWLPASEVGYSASVIPSLWIQPVTDGVVLCMELTIKMLLQADCVVVQSHAVQRSSIFIYRSVRMHFSLCVIYT